MSRILSSGKASLSPSRLRAWCLSLHRHLRLRSSGTGSATARGARMHYQRAASSLSAEVVAFGRGASAPCSNLLSRTWRNRNAKAVQQPNEGDGRDAFIPHRRSCPAATASAPPHRAAGSRLRRAELLPQGKGERRIAGGHRHELPSAGGV